jgi:hypothetical protein
MVLRAKNAEEPPLRYTRFPGSCRFGACSRAVVRLGQRRALCPSRAVCRLDPTCSFRPWPQSFQSRNDQAAIKEYLDREWQKKMRSKRDADAGKALRQAAKTGDSEAVRALIEAGVPVDHKGGDYEQTALHYAAREGRTATVEVLLANGIQLQHETLKVYLQVYSLSGGSAAAPRVVIHADVAPFMRPPPLR